MNDFIGDTDNKTFYYKSLCPPANSAWIPKEGIGEYIARSMKKHKTKIAQIDPKLDHFVSYETLLSQCISVAKQMKVHGLVENDIISICSRNRLESCVPIFASYLIGIIPSSLDPSLPLDDTVHLIKIIKPKMIFCEPEAVKLIEQATKLASLTSNIIVFGDTEIHIPFSLFLTTNSEINEEFQPFKPKNLRDTALILFSSGTTGLSKAICLSHYGLLFQVALIRDARCTSVYMFYASSYWISSNLLMLALLEKGDTRIVSSNFEVDSYLKYIEKYQVTSGTLPPFYAYQIVKNKDLCKKYDVSSMRYISVGGGKFGNDHFETLRNIFINAITCNAYGLTEACGVVTIFMTPQENELIKRKGTSIGHTIPGIKYKIIDLNKNEIAGPNQKGELRIKSDFLMNGYFNNEEETMKQFDEDGYLHTGDLCYYDEDYCFYYVDRIKDIIKFQSWHVSPITTEIALLSHPHIKEAIVIGRPNEADGEHPMAIVVLQSGVTVSENKIIKYVEGRVPDRYRLRGGVKIVENIPKTPSGKPRRLALLQQILSEII